MIQREESVMRVPTAVGQTIMAQAVEIATELAVGTRFSIDPKSVRVTRQNGWYYCGFGDPDNRSESSGAAQFIFSDDRQSATIAFHQLLHGGKEPFRGKRWCDLHQSKSFLFISSGKGEFVYQPPLNEEQLFARYLASKVLSAEELEQQGSGTIWFNAE